MRRLNQFIFIIIIEREYSKIILFEWISIRPWSTRRNPFKTDIRSMIKNYVTLIIIRVSENVTWRVLYLYIFSNL